MYVSMLTTRPCRSLLMTFVILHSFHSRISFPPAFQYLRMMCRPQKSYHYQNFLKYRYELPGCRMLSSVALPPEVLDDFDGWRLPLIYVSTLTISP